MVNIDRNDPPETKTVLSFQADQIRCSAFLPVPCSYAVTVHPLRILDANLRAEGIFARGYALKFYIYQTHVSRFAQSDRGSSIVLGLEAAEPKWLMRVYQHSDHTRRISGRVPAFFKITPALVDDDGGFRGASEIEEVAINNN